MGNDDDDHGNNDNDQKLLMYVSFHINTTENEWFRNDKLNCKQ